MIPGPNDTLVFLVVTHNGERHLKKLLDSLPIGARVVVVDNASTDGTRRMIEKYKAEETNEVPLHHRITPVYCPENRGYATGINMGMAFIRSSAKWVFVLNQDITLSGNSQISNTTSQENEGQKNENPPYQIPYTAYHPYAVVQPRILLPNGRVNVDELRMNVWGFVFPPDYNTPPEVKTPKETSFFSGAAFLLNVDKYNKIGVFDKSLFLYYEEVDYALRIAAAREKILFDPTWSVTHNYTLSTASPRKMRLLLRNRSHLMRRYASPLHQLLTLSAFPRSGETTDYKLPTTNLLLGFHTRQFPQPIRLIINGIAVPMSWMIKKILSFQNRPPTTA